jgi:CRISPR-associated protein Cmr5
MPFNDDEKRGITMQTRNQLFAAKIFSQIESIKVLPEAQRKKYGATAHKLPILIRKAGLAQALEFIAARGDDTQRQLLAHIAVTIDLPSQAELLKRSREAQLEEYIHMTQRVLDALLWYKRFSQSVLNVDGSEGEA